MATKYFIKYISLMFLALIHAKKACSQTLSNNGVIISIGVSTEISSSNGNLFNNSGTINNEGTLTFGGDYNNAGLFSGSGTYNVGGDFINTGTYSPGLSTVNYNGAGAQDVSSLNYSNLILSNSGVKTFSSGITGIADSLTIVGATADAIVNLTTIDYNGSGNQNVASLTYYNLNCSNNGAKLSEGDIILNNVLTLSGTASFDADGFADDKEFTLISNAFGTARVDYLPIPSNFTGEITMERYIDAGATDWRFLTSAVTGTTLAEFNGDFITSGFTGSDYPTWPSAANPWVSIYFYDESLSGHIDIGFTEATNTSNPVGVGEGIWVWSGTNNTVTQPFTIDMKGAANTGDINLPITYTNSGIAAEDGWNMVGNPYPSTMDWDDPSITKTNINAAIYIWDPDLRQYASYLSPFGINGGTKNIASSQAFWVHASGASPVVTVTESCKTEDGGAFFKQSSVTPLTISVSNAHSSDETIINFEANATAGFDANYDAVKITSVVGNVPTISTLISGNIDLAINQLPAQEIHIPLKIKTGAAGMHQIDFAGISMFSSNSCLILEDLFTGVSYDLNTTNTFNLYISDTTESARFLIKFGALIDISITDVSCFGAMDGEILFEKNSTNAFDVVWKNSLGNIIASNIGVNLSDGLNSLSPGMYTIESSDLVCGSSVDSVTVNEPNQIVSQFTSSSDTIYMSNGASIAFINQSSNASYYDWDFGDANTSNSSSPTNQYHQAGTYIVSLNAFQQVGCNELASTIITVLNTYTGIDQVSDANNIQVVAQNTSLVVDAVNPKRIEVFNAIGQVVLTSSSPENHQELELNGLSSQVLIVKVSCSTKAYYKKVNFVNF
ncbi:MAG: hypothetical protein ACI8Q1_001999 [Parvicella sp.]|jgi:hypothetical protein